MERTRGFVGGILLAAIPIGLITGVLAGPIWLLAAVSGGLLFVAFTRAGGAARWRSEPAWQPTSPFRYVPSAGATKAGRGQVVRALGRVESRWLLPGSVAFAAGIGFCLLELLFFGILQRDYPDRVDSVVELLTIMAHPLAGMTVLAVYRARTRGRRDGAEELFGSCPSSEQTRNLAHLCTAWVAAVAAVGFAVTMVLTVRFVGGHGWGSFGARQLSHILGAGVLVVGAVALGVALARLAPWSLAPVLAVGAIALGSVQLATSGDRPTDGSRQLSTWITAIPSNVDVRFTVPRWLEHHLWVVALVAVMMTIALFRDTTRRRLVVSALAVCVFATAVAGYAATRPIDPVDARRVASLLADPAAHQTCVDGGVPICAYGGDGAVARAYVPHVRAITDVVPRGVLAGTRLRQGAMVDRKALDPAIAAFVPAEVSDGALPFDMVDYRDSFDAGRLWLALRATGVVGLSGWDRLTDLAGQARGVVVLWLATRGQSDSAARRLTSVRPNDPAGPSPRPWPDPCFAGRAPVRWALTDLTAARRLHDAPDAEVVAAVRQHWSEFVDPATTTDSLLASLHLAPVGPPTGSTPESEPCIT